MSVFDNFKKIISRIFYNSSLLNSSNSIENVPTTNKISIIDTSSLNINRDLNDEEKIRLDIYSKEINLSINKILEYGNEASRKVSYYMEISRKRLNQNIEKNQEFLKEATARNIISQKLDIEFNNLEIRSILEDLQNIKRECELRIIALEEKGKAEIKKRKRLTFFLDSKVDLSKINSINNAIERLKTTIKIIEMLSNSIINEQIATSQEEYSLNRFIENNDSEENDKIINELLNERFIKQKETLIAIQKIGGKEDEISKSLLNVNLESKELSEKLKTIVETKKFIDLYVEKNKKDFLKPDGLFEKTQNALDSLWQNIKTDYFDRELWAKKEFEGFEKYDQVLENVERIINIFEEEILDDFKKKFYRVKFYEKALCNEHNPSDVGHTFPIKNETERKYYSEILSEIIDKIHRTSDDAELLKFMDKYLGIRDLESILNDYEKITALLRIEKDGRDGLFTLRLFKMNKFLEEEDFKTIFYSKDKPSIFSAAILSTKLLSDISLNDLSKIYGIVNVKYKKLDFDNLFGDQLEKYGASSKFALEILNLWANTQKTIGSIYKLMNSEYFDELPKRVVIPDIFDEIEFTKTMPDEIKNITYSGFFTASSNKNDFRKYNKCTRFQAETEQLINRNIRLEKNKPENERKWKSNHTKVKFINERTGKEEVYNISLAEIICRFSTALETMMKGKISKIDIRDKILQSDNFNIGQEIKSYTYDELIKEITKCLFIGKDNELIQAAKELTKDYLFEDRTKIVELKNALSENITNFIVNGGERKVDFTFFKILECFGNNKFEIFEKRGLKAKATDFARALGGCDNYYWTSDMVNKYILNEYTNSIFVDFKQNGIKYSSKPFCSARPIMYLSNILDIQSNGNGLKKSKDGVFEVEYGYYPQNFAPKEMQNKLEKYFKNGNLQNTKNIYHIYDKSLNDNVFAHNLKEYEYEGKRYVRLDEKYVRQSTLNSWDYISKGAWFEVLPVKWLVNEKFDVMVTYKLIFSGIPFDSNDKTKGKFENTDIKKFMDSFLTKDIEQSTSIALLEPQILYYFLNQKEHIQINEQERI